MDRSRQTLSATDEVKLIRSEIRSAGSLESVRRLFERLQEIRREQVDDFDLQISIADVQQELIERARVLRAEKPIITAPLPPPIVSDRSAPEPEPEEAEIPAEVPKLDRKSWQLAVGLAILLTVGICAAFFYLIQTARRLNFASEQPAPAAAPSNAANTAKTTPVAAVATPASTAPALRLYTDLTAGTATIDDQPAKELVDGELNLDSLTPGAHSVKVEGRSGSAAFNFVLDNNTEVPRVTEILPSNNAMLVLVSVKNGTGRLSSDSSGATLSLDGKSAGTIGGDGLLLSDLGTRDHDLDLSRGRDNQKFVLTYTPAPTLTVFVKSDPSTGVLTVSTGQDGVFVFINDLPYRRPTVHGEVRIPLKVGTYRIRVHKDGLPDPAPALVEVKKSAEASVQFHLQPAAQEFATLQIKGAQPATSVSIDHQLAGTVGVDGTAKVINIRPGEHLIELHHEQAINKQLTRAFEAGQSVTLSGADVSLDRLAADNKSVIPGGPGAVLAPPEVPHLENPLPAGVSNEQVHHGGGFVPYHTPKTPGSYYFQAHTKLGGVFKRKSLQWYAGYQDASNYVLFSLDGKHADVKEVRDGKQVDVGRVALPVTSDEWVQIEVSVRADTLQARAKTSEGGWIDLAPVTTTGRDFTKNGVGLYIPSNDDVAVANFRFTSR